jgi:hypothetical protein
MVNEGDTIVCWFSCGAASATALDLTNKQYGNIAIVRAVNNPVAEEDSDNLRFARDVENYTGVKIETAVNFSFPDNSAVSVWQKRRFMSGPKGAPCTGLLKKEARRTWEDLNWPEIEAAGKQLHHVFGFTDEEEHRHARRVDDGMNVLPILIERGMSKQDCFDYITAAGLILPRVYSEASRFGTGYPNANCIGCVKATNPTYWNHVRETRPEVFKERADQSRELGCRLARYKGKRIFLDELPPDAKGRSMKTMKIDCGIICERTET